MNYEAELASLHARWRQAKAQSEISGEGLNGQLIESGVVDAFNDLMYRMEIPKTDPDDMRLLVEADNNLTHAQRERVQNIVMYDRVAALAWLRDRVPLANRAYTVAMGLLRQGGGPVDTPQINEMLVLMLFRWLITREGVKDA